MLVFKKQLKQIDLVACLKPSETIQTHAEDFTIMINIVVFKHRRFPTKGKNCSQGELTCTFQSANSFIFSRIDL